MGRFEEVLSSGLGGLLLLGAERDQAEGFEGASPLPLSREAVPPESWAVSLCVQDRSLPLLEPLIPIWIMKAPTLGCG